MLPAAIGSPFVPRAAGRAQPALTGRFQTAFFRSCLLAVQEESMQQATHAPKVVIITGPTGVGKTAVGLLLAQRLNGEVVSADSVQVYKGLDIGSDKLPVSERQGVTHHLIDVCDLKDDYAAGRFHDEGRAAIRDILARGKVPVVVGGTGFYLRLLVEGKPAAARATPELAQQVEDTLQQAWEEAALSAGLPLDPETGRPAVNQLTAAVKWQAGVAVLGKLGDQEAMDRIRKELNNYFRLKRALAILISNPGKTMKELDVGTAADSPEQYDWRTFFLYRQRNTLYKKVDHRLQEMVLGGLLDEASMLLLQGMQPGTNMACSAVGYRQAMIWLLQAVVDVEETGQVKVTLADLVTAIAIATHKLIRNQMTWFRDRKEYKWLDMEQLGGPEAAADLIMTQYQAVQHQGEMLPGGGYLSKDQRNDHKSRELQLDVLKARPQDVQRVMQRVSEVLVPQIASAPATAAAIQAERQTREKRRQEEGLRQQDREAKRQKQHKQKQSAKQQQTLEQQQEGEDQQQPALQASQLVSTSTDQASEQGGVLQRSETGSVSAADSDSSNGTANRSRRKTGAQRRAPKSPKHIHAA